MRRIFIYIAACGFWLLGTKQVGAEITVAVVAPKAGAYALMGEQLNKGAEQAVNEINREGGVLGAKIHLLSIDDQCNDSIAISTAQMLSILKDRHVNLVIGPYCANSFDIVAETYAKAKIFQIIPTTVNYTQAKTIKKGLIKMLGYNTQQAKDFFNYYNQNFAGNKIAVVSKESDAESQEIAEAIMQEFVHHGKSILAQKYTYEMTGKDYDKLAQQIRRDGVQMAFLLGNAKNIRKMARALKENDEQFVLFTNKYSATEEYFSYLDDLAEGTYFMELRGRNDDPDLTETLVKLRLSGFDAEGLSLYGYSAVKLWETAVKRAKSFDYNKLSAAVNDKSIRTEFGNKMFHNGMPKASENYAIYQYVDGNYSKVY